MSLQTTYFYDFGEFRLDITEKVLLRVGTAVSLTPKVFKTLCILVENAGHLTGKDELMQRLWADRFVEESNLTFNIKMLRKALGDDAHHPQFIETVPTRGYRFIAEVRLVEKLKENKEERKTDLTADSTALVLPFHVSDRVAVSNSRQSAVVALADWRREQSEPEEIDNISASAIPADISTDRSKNGFSQQIKKNKMLAAFTVLLLLFAAIGFGYRFFVNRAAGTKQIESIAVLPFVNIGNDPEMDYLSDGISASLIDRLSQLPQLKVIARNSSFRYRGENMDIREVAEKLGVQAIITGRVERQNDNLSIRVELIDASDNRQLWSEQYNRRAADLLTIQQEIAQTVSAKLRLKLSGEQEKNIAKQHTVNPQAYELLLKGQLLQNKHGTENKKKAAEFYQQAISVDPNYAPAYAALSISYSDLTHNGIFDPKEFTPKAEEAAQKALELDENLPEAHHALALLKLNSWDWAAAGQEYRRAIELNPNFAKAHSGYAFYLSLIGQHDEAIAEFKRTKEINPLLPAVITGLAYGYYHARRYDEAIETLNISLELEPDNVYTNGIIAHTYLAKGMYSEAVAAFRHVIELGGEPGYRIYLGAAYAKSGDRIQAQEILNNLENTENYVSPGELAVLYAALGDREKTFSSFERAYALHDAQLQFLLVEPAFDPFRNDPRFQDLLRKVGLTQ